MKSDSFRFGPFALDVESRLLRRDDVVVNVSSRYFDALVLMVRHAGELVPKERFMDEVWRGVPVTDEALTQCIRSLRRVLADDAARPRFIATVPKHGYRFIAHVHFDDAGQAAGQRILVAPGRDWRAFWSIGGAGIVGGGIAGLIGGIFYGLSGGSQGMGGASIILVLTALTVLIALTGSAGVSFGMAAATLMKCNKTTSTILGGAVGGFLVGGIVKLLGLDAFNLLLGQSPTNITGALEGAVLGAAVGLGVYWGRRAPSHVSVARKSLPAAAFGIVAGVAIPVTGGKLLGGSLNALMQALPQSRLRLDQIGTLFGESGFGPISEIVTGGLEGMLFAACMTGAVLLAERQRVA